MIADDLFLDGQFADFEKAEVEAIEVVVEAPRTTRDLLRRLIRVRRGNAELRELVATGELRMQIRPSDRWAWLRDVVMPEPTLILAAIPYVGLTLAAATLARWPAKVGREWGRDESTRRAKAPVP